MCVAEGRQKKISEITGIEVTEEHLRQATEKYLDYYNISYQYVGTVIDRMKNRFSEEELKVIERVLTVMRDELMTEVKY